MCFLTPPRAKAKADSISPATSVQWVFFLVLLQENQPYSRASDLTSTLLRLSLYLPMHKCGPLKYDPLYKCPQVKASSRTLLSVQIHTFPLFLTQYNFPYFPVSFVILKYVLISIFLYSLIGYILQIINPSYNGKSKSALFNCSSVKTLD